MIEKIKSIRSLMYKNLE